MAFFSENEVLGLGKWNGLIEYTRNDLTTCIQKEFSDKIGKNPVWKIAGFYAKSILKNLENQKQPLLSNFRALILDYLRNFRFHKLQKVRKVKSRTSEY